MTDVIHRNAPATAAGLGSAVALFLGSLVAWAMTSVPDSVPQAVTSSGTAVLLGGVVAVGAGIGRYAQRFTFPVNGDDLFTGDDVARALARNRGRQIDPGVGADILDDLEDT